MVLTMVKIIAVQKNETDNNAGNAGDTQPQESIMQEIPRRTVILTTASN